jgi:hypothetical protein
LTRLAVKDAGKYCGHFVYFPAIWYIFWSFWYNFSRFGMLYQKNLATLGRTKRGLWRGGDRDPGKGIVDILSQLFK